MKLFATELMICATAYIRAETPAQALTIAQRDLADQGLEFCNRWQGIDANICMDGRPFEVLLDNDEDIALSPAVTVVTKQFRLNRIEEAHDFEEDNDDAA
jgi:hypothetical protein